MVVRLYFFTARCATWVGRDGGRGGLSNHYSITTEQKPWQSKTAGKLAHTSERERCILSPQILVKKVLRIYIFMCLLMFMHKESVCSIFEAHTVVQVSHGAVYRSGVKII